MKTQDFKKAANKHYITCKYLLSNTASSNRKEIYSSAYYLSGYVLECILKYSYLQHLHKTNVTDQELREFGLKSHDLNQLYGKVINKVPQNRNWPQKLPKSYSKWCTEVRYELHSTQKDILDELNELFNGFVHTIFKSVYCSY